MVEHGNQKTILHVVSSLEVGGAERFVIDLCQVQRTKGAEVAILSFGRPTDPLIKECEKNKITVFHTGEGRYCKWRDGLVALRQFETIHFHSPYPLKFLLPILSFCLFKQIIYTRHGADPLAGISWKIIHKIANYFVDQVSFVSKEGAEVFEKSHGWLRKTKHVIDNGVNLSDIKQTRTSSSLLRLGSVGRMVPLKNQLCLLKAIVTLPKEIKDKVEVHFYGDGPCLQALEQFVENHNLKRQVLFHGMVSDRNTIYNSFDVLIVTSETEGLSLAIIEAMAYSCPVIATNVGGNPKLVSHDVNGFLFKFNDEFALSSNLRALFENPQLRDSFSLASQDKVAEQFSLNVCADKYQLLYER